MSDAPSNPRDARPLLQVIVASTRPGRVGLSVGQWFYAEAERHGGFALEFVDLAEVDLPFLDEPNHPRLRKYTHAHTKAWSERVERADAFAFVMPEYNHGLSAPLKNAIDYLNQEWRYKAVGLVSYGGVSGGTRAAQMLKPVLAVLKMVPMSEAVIIPFVQQFVDDDGAFRANEVLEKAAKAMLDEMLRWTEALGALREASRGG